MRAIDKRYMRHFFTAMTAYVIIMLTVWRLVRTTESHGLRVAIALLPVIPILFVIRAMVRYILDADELVQRLHLEALAIAAGVVAVASLIGGFLAAAEVIRIDGSILIWVFPVIALVFGIARAFGERRYARA
ncbi:MAG: hypothetical protein ABIR27_01255 [Dokdonella sp.]